MIRQVVLHVQRTGQHENMNNLITKHYITTAATTTKQGLHHDTSYDIMPGSLYKNKTCGLMLASTHKKAPFPSEEQPW